MRARFWATAALLATVGCAGSSSTPTRGGPMPEPRTDSAPAVKNQHTLADPKGRFSVTLPAPPVSVPPPREVVTRPDSPLQFAVWQATDGDTRYSISAIYAPTELLDANPALGKFGTENNPYWQVVNRQQTTIDGQPATQVEYREKEGARTTISIVTRFQGTQVSLSIIGLAGLTAESQEAKDYFGSFRFTR
jgi:hypothetical protein